MTLHQVAPLLSRPKCLSRLVDTTAYSPTSRHQTDRSEPRRTATARSKSDTALTCTLHSMYKTIDATPLGDIPWESFTLQYNGTQPTENVLSWMTAEHDIWFQDPHVLVHNILSNATFESGFDYAPFQECAADGTHRFCDFMSRNWAWMQVVHFHYHLLKKYSFG